MLDDAIAAVLVVTGFLIVLLLLTYGFLSVRWVLRKLRKQS